MPYRTNRVVTREEAEALREEIRRLELSRYHWETLYRREVVENSSLRHRLTAAKDTLRLWMRKATFVLSWVTALIFVGMMSGVEAAPPPHLGDIACQDGEDPIPFQDDDPPPWANLPPRLREEIEVVCAPCVYSECNSAPCLSSAFFADVQLRN